MRVKVPCGVCANVPDPGTYNFLLFDGELDNIGYVHVSCNVGHKSIVVYDSRRYEVLLQSATSALLDGYSNEAIATYSAALERAYEFYIRVVLCAHGINQKNIESAWKGVSSQSERQFGAFHFLRLLEHGEALELDEDIPKVRNAIIHRGKIASTDLASDFGSRVFLRIKQIESSLTKFPDDVQAEQEYEIEVQKQKVPSGIESVVMKSFSLKVDSETGEVVVFPETFDDYLSAVSNGRNKGWIA